MATQGRPESFSAVVAMERNRGIGLSGQLPWKLAGDMRFFRELTTCPDSTAVEQRFGLATPEAKRGDPILLKDFLTFLKTSPALPLPTLDRRNAVLMGRHTWESLPTAFKPLPGRLNGIISRQGLPGEEVGHPIWASLQDAFSELRKDESIQNVFVIGGAQLYAQAIHHTACRRIYATFIEEGFGCDVFFPEIPASFREIATSDRIQEEGIHYRFSILDRDES